MKTAKQAPTKPVVMTGKPATASVEIDGTNYPLAYSFTVIANTEPESGVNLLHALRNMGNLSAMQLRGLFLAAIRSANPKSTMTITEAGQLIRFDSVIEITEALAKSLILSIPENSRTEQQAAAVAPAA
jgi:hypothetical protein